MKKQGATLVQRVSAKVAGFKTLHKRLEKKIVVSGKSMSTLNNYMRCISHLALHFNCLPTQLDLEQIEEYLVHLKKKGASEADFKLTVFGLKSRKHYPLSINNSIASTWYQRSKTGNRSPLRWGLIPTVVRSANNRR